MLNEPTAEDGELRRLRTLYRALGDTIRLRILGLLAELGPVAVNELSNRVLVSQPLISWHLRILRLAGFIETERHGREVICRLRPAAFAELHAAEERLLAGRRNTEGAGSPSGAGALAGHDAGLPDVG